VGSLFEYVDRHDHHRDGTYPLAHNPVPSLNVSGPVRFPLGLRLYRRDEELTQWAACVAQHVPHLKIPTDTKGRNRLHQQVDPVRLQDPECRARHEPFRTIIALAIEVVEEAIRHKVPFGVVGFDAWYLAEDVMWVLARRRKAWISLLKTNRRLETASVHLRDARGWTLKRPGPHLAVEELVPLFPAHAYRPVTVGEHTYGCFTLAIRVPGLGKVRIVVSIEQASLEGPLCGAGHESRGLERGQDHRPVRAPLADGDLPRTLHLFLIIEKGATHPSVDHRKGDHWIRVPLVC
jgi:hypothetical protein